MYLKNTRGIFIINNKVHKRAHTKFDIESVGSSSLRIKFLFIASLLSLFSFAPHVLANSCALNAPSTIQLDPGGTAAYSVSCDVLCTVTNSSLPPGDLTITPASMAVGVSPVTFTITSALNSGSPSLDVKWVCPAPTGLTEDTRTVQITGDPDSTAKDNVSSGSDGDPISTFNGELYEQAEPDLHLGGPLPLFFSRYYASKIKDNTLRGVSLFPSGGWRDNFSWTVTDPASASKKTIISAKGRTIEFTLSGNDWVLSGKTDIPFQLTRPVQFGPYFFFDPRSQLTYEFDGGFPILLMNISDNNGNTHTLNYDGQLNLQSVSDGLGRTLNFTIDAPQLGSKVISVDDGQGRNVSFDYIPGSDGFGFLLNSVTDARSMITTYTYQLDNLMTSTTRPEGNSPFSQTWTVDEKVATQTNASGNTFTFAYVSPDTTMTDPLGNSRMHTHTATGELSNSQDQAGNSVVIGSDANGRRSSVTDRLGDVISYTFDPVSGNKNGTIHADGSSDSVTFTTRTSGSSTASDVTGVTFRDASTRNFSYDASGNLISNTDQLGNAASATFNSNGQSLSSTNRAGAVTTRTYNADQTLATATDASGNTTTISYDVYKRPIQATLEDGSVITLSFDDNDNVISIVNAKGNTVLLAYDDNNNLISITDSLGGVSQLVYDGNDRVIGARDKLNNLSSITYDELGRVSSSTDFSGNTSLFNYDSRNRLTSVVDASGNSSARSYDLEGVLASITDPRGNTANFTSDKMGRMTQLSSPLGFSTSLNYDSMGRILSATDPLNNTTNFSYDAKGQLVSSSLPGSTISAGYLRDELGQITSITDPNGNNWLHSYDNQGRKTGATDPIGNSQTVSYDNRNRPSIVTFPGGLGTLNIGYDAVGNVTTKSYSDGLTLNYTYDDNNRLLSANGINLVRDANGRITNSNGIGMLRDTNGRVTSMTLAPSKTVTYSYDANNRVSQISDWVGGMTTFSYDAAGNMTAIMRPNGMTTTKTYDNDNRLIGIAENSSTTSSSISLVLDAKGQVTSATRNLPQIASAANLSASSQTTDSASQLNGVTYDAMGRTTLELGVSYSWGLDSNLTSATTASGTTSFVNDAMGRHVSKTLNSVVKAYKWNYGIGSGVVNIEQQDGVDFVYNIFLPTGQLHSSINASDDSRRFYHFDIDSNTTFITDDSLQITSSYAYTTFGEITSSSGNLSNPFTWKGELGVMDEGNGMFTIGTRYFNANSGRYITRNRMVSVAPFKINPYHFSYNSNIEFTNNTPPKANDIIQLRGSAFVRNQQGGFTRIAEDDPIIDQLDFSGTNSGVTYGVNLNGLGLSSASFVNIDPSGIDLDSKREAADDASIKQIDNKIAILRNPITLTKFKFLFFESISSFFSSDPSISSKAALITDTNPRRGKKTELTGKGIFYFLLGVPPEVIAFVGGEVDDSSPLSLNTEVLINDIKSVVPELKFVPVL